MRWPFVFLYYFAGAGVVFSFSLCSVILLFWTLFVPSFAKTSPPPPQKKGPFSYKFLSFGISVLVMLLLLFSCIPSSS